MLFAKLGVVLCMLLGLFGTFIHRVPGTPLIFMAALIYRIYIGFSIVDIRWMAMLLILMLTAELGSRYLRRRLMPEAAVSTAFGLDVAAGSFVSLIMTEIFAGSVVGLLLWELLIGKSLMPLIKHSGMLVINLFVGAVFRFMIAIVMIIIISYKVL